MLSVFGSVNGQQRFDRESVLCDTGNQHLNVSLSVNSHFDGNLHQLTVRRLDTDQVNGQRIWRDSGDESVLVTYQMSARDVVETPVAFREKLVVEELSLEGDTLFGVSLRDVQRTMGVRRLLEEQTRGFDDLVRVVERATKQAANGKCGLHVFQNWEDVMRLSDIKLHYLWRTIIYGPCVCRWAIN